MTGTITAAKGAGGVKVVAQNTAFDTKEIDLPADTPSKLTVDNKDPFAHNLSIYEDDTASGRPLFTFEPFSGPATKTFDVRGDPGGRVLLPLRHPPDDERDGRGRAAPPPGEGGASANRARGGRAPSTDGGG